MSLPDCVQGVPVPTEAKEFQSVPLYPSKLVPVHLNIPATGLEVGLPKTKSVIETKSKIPLLAVIL